MAAHKRDHSCLFRLSCSSQIQIETGLSALTRSRCAALSSEAHAALQGAQKHAFNIYLVRILHLSDTRFGRAISEEAFPESIAAI